MMIKKVIGCISVLLIISLIGSMFVACNYTSDRNEDATREEKSGAPVRQAAGDNKAFEYPIKTDVTLKYWVALNSNVAKTAKSLSETSFAKELEKRTGIKVEYIHPPAGQETDSFNLLISSGSYPDIIEYAWTAYPGGPEKAITDGIIIQLNDVFDKYAPNLKKYLEENPSIAKDVKTDTGKHFVFPYLKPDEFSKVYAGPIVRKDWLDDLNLQVPETIDEWYSMLKAFKEKKDAAAPLSCYWNESFITGAYGIVGTFYVENSKIKYGPIEPEYKNFLITLRKWYAEGLYDKNFSTLDPKTLDANMLGGKSGATVGYASSNIGRWMTAMQDKDPKYKLAGAPNPTLNKGEKAEFGQLALTFLGTGAAITSACKNIEVAARFLDYAYGNEGGLLFNYGIENESYKMVDGKPIYTELITNNPDKLTLSVALSKYSRGSYSGPFIQDKGFAEQFFNTPEQKDAIAKWMNMNMAKHIVPNIIPTPEESSEQAKILNEIKTYTNEMLLKFIMGDEPIENFDKFVEQLKKLNIEKAISLKQAQLDRYYKR